MTRELRSAVNGVMFGSCDRFQVFRIAALKPFDEIDGHASGEEGILAIGLLSTTPARISENIDIWSPESESGIDAANIVARKKVVFGACLIADGIPYTKHQILIKCSRKSYCLGENSCLASSGNTMQTLIPPIVSRDSQSFDRLCLVKKLSYLFLQGHARHKVFNSFIKGDLGILIR